VLVLVVVAARLFHHSTPSDDNKNMAKAHDDNNMIQYKLVETGTTSRGGGLDFQRYLAIIGNDDDTAKPVSVYEWTRQLASDKTNAHSFVQVLKVRRVLCNVQYMHTCSTECIIHYSSIECSLQGVLFRNQGCLFQECKGKGL
jgi:hypothetical protein